nr:pectinesterase inhibitor [Tanacetum cinerariifolium]
KELNRAVTDLGVRDVTMLSDDFGAVEADISACQACFTENIGEDSPLKALEEATSKAARECLTVMDYAA